MAVFTIQAPDGRKIKIRAADQETALRGAKEWAAANPAGGGGPPAGAQPGSREYADWAIQQAMQGKELPQVSPKPPEFGNDTSPMGQILAGYTSAVNAIPVAGPSLMGGLNQAKGAMYGVPAEQIASENAGREAGNPIASTTGAVAGTLLPLMALGGTSLGGRLLGQSGSYGQQVGMSALSGGALSGADTLARGGSMGDAAINAGLGAGVGAALPAVGGWLHGLGQKAAQTKATSAAIKGAPNVEDLKAAASSLFENSRAANAGVTGNKFAQFAAGLIQKARSKDIDEVLDGEALAAYRRMATMAQEAMQSGGMTFSRLHNLRQMAQDVVIEAKKPRTQQFAQSIVDGLDDLISNLKPGDMVGSGGKQAANDLLEGISTWSRAKKLALIEEAITKAGFQKSGVENGLRLQFQALLRNPKTRAMFNAAERLELDKVANGTTSSNIMTLLGKLGFGLGNNGNNVVGGSIGLLMGGLPLAVGGTLARKGAEKMALSGAQRAANVVATPGVPVLPMKALPRGMIPASALAVDATRKRPIDITVKY